MYNIFLRSYSTDDTNQSRFQITVLSGLLQVRKWWSHYNCNAKKYLTISLTLYILWRPGSNTKGFIWRKSVGDNCCKLHNTVAKKGKVHTNKNANMCDVRWVVLCLCLKTFSEAPLSLRYQQFKMSGTSFN